MIDGIQALKRLHQAAMRFVSLDLPHDPTDSNFQRATGLIADAGEALRRIRRVFELEEMLIELSALVEARAAEGEIRAKAKRAAELSEALMGEFAVAWCAELEKRAGDGGASEEAAPQTEARLATAGAVPQMTTTARWRAE